MASVLTIGAALIDVFVRSDDFSLISADAGMQLCQKYGEKIDVDEFFLSLGGGAANVAVGLARRGHRAALISELGRDVLSDMVRSTLIQEQVSVEHVVREKSEKTGMSIILLAPEGGRTVLVHRGASTQLEATDVFDESLQSAEWIHLTNVYGQTALVEKVLRLAQRSGGKVSWNPGSADIAALVENKLDVDLLSTLSFFQVNDSEWEQLGSLHAMLSKHIEIVVVTKGKAGGEAFEHGRSLHFTSPVIPVVDETGAGDAFAVGVIDGLLKKQNVATALEWGVASSLAVISKLGAQAGLVRT